MRLTGPAVHPAVAAAAAGLCLAVLALADPSTSPWFPPCLWRAATGWQCPGCGSARAIHALLHGHLLTAFALNPIAVVTLPVVASDVVQRWRGRGHGWLADLRPGYILGLAVVLVLFGVLRNLAQ